ncbi:peptidoglycan-binding protein, partial [Paracidovorax avenae]
PHVPGAAAAVVAPAPLPAMGASAASAAAAPQPVHSVLQDFLAAQPSGDAAAWRALAAAWGVKGGLEGGDACDALQRQGLRCYRQRRASLALVRQLDRPGWLTLYPSADAPVSVLLAGFDPVRQTALLEGAGGRRLEVSAADLAQAWRGEFATLWRAPAQWPAGGRMESGPPPAQAWLDAQLARAGAGASPAAGQPAATAAQRRARIYRFQVAQGLVPDGVAGPLTLMLLNRAAGVDEPRLKTS